MTETQIFSMIGSLGFPIAVTIFLLIKFDKTISSLKDVISTNNVIIAKLCEHLNINANPKDGG
jgi:hypothetical protein